MPGLLLLFMGLSSCQVSIGPDVSTGPLTVVYSVTGTSHAAKISYNNDKGGMTTVKSWEDGGMSSDGEMKWSKLVTVPAGSFAYITAQNDRTEGTVRVEIESLGKVKS